MNKKTQRRASLGAVIVATLVLAILLNAWWLVLSLGLLILGVFGYLEDVVGIQVPKRLTVILLILFVLFSLGQMVLTKYEERVANKELRTTRQALADATNEIARLALTTDALARYAPLAKLNGEGKAGLVSGVLTEDSDLIRLLDGCLTTKNGEDTVSTTPEARAKYTEAIERFPDYPFSYYYLALYFHAKGDQQWRAYAVKAEAIFRRTTTIAGHHAAHDAALKQVQEWIGDQKQERPNKMPRHVP